MIKCTREQELHLENRELRMALENVIRRLEYVCEQEDKKHYYINDRASRDAAIKQARQLVTRQLAELCQLVHCNSDI
jgi:hypothetical protein